MSFLPGKDVERPSLAHGSAVGEILARIHLAGRSFPEKMENPRGLTWWQTVMPAILPFLPADDAALLRQEVSYQSLQKFPAMPRGAIHADLFRDNVLFENTHISGVIDFYFACTDTLLYDVAICVNDWCIEHDGRLHSERTDAVLKAYRKVRPFERVEGDAWPAMLRAGALRFWISRLHDFHLPRPGELTHAKDPSHFQRILRQHVAHERELRPLPL